MGGYQEAGARNALVIVPHVASCYTHPVVTIKHTSDLSMCVIFLTCGRRDVLSQNPESGHQALQPLVTVISPNPFSNRLRFCWTAERTISVSLT